MKNQQTGATGEELVCKYIVKRSMKVLARNYRCRGGEIDIIANDGDTIAFIEVKTRRGARYGTPAEAVTRVKMNKIIKTAEYYIMNEKPGDTGFRFDVAEVTGGSDGYYSVNYIKNAFEA